MLDTEIDTFLTAAGDDVSGEAQALREVENFPSAIVVRCDTISTRYGGAGKVGAIVGAVGYAADGNPAKVERVRKWNQLVADFTTVRSKAVAAVTWNHTNAVM